MFTIDPKYFPSEHWMPPVDHQMFGELANSRVSQIFITCITFLSKYFSKLIKWPSRNQVKKDMRKSLSRRPYPKTRVIIDCTEFWKGQDLHLSSLILT